jgi:hypothetical protein
MCEFLYTKLMSLSVRDRRKLFTLINYYIRDTTFANHLRNIDVTSDRSITLNCQILFGFNNQPGLREQVVRWLTEALDTHSI